MTVHNPKEKAAEIIQKPQNEETYLRKLTQVVYFCQGISLIPITCGLGFIVGVVINYLKRDAVKGMQFESHFNWQIRTFWILAISMLLGSLLSLVLIGFLLIAAAIIWIIYRVVKGYLCFYEGKPIENDQAML